MPPPIFCPDAEQRIGGPVRRIGLDTKRVVDRRAGTDVTYRTPDILVHDVDLVTQDIRI